jgi:hypothetical protein
MGIDDTMVVVEEKGESACSSGRQLVILTSPPKCENQPSPVDPCNDLGVE